MSTIAWNSVGGGAMIGGGAALSVAGAVAAYQAARHGDVTAGLRLLPVVGIGALAGAAVAGVANSTMPHGYAQRTGLLAGAGGAVGVAGVTLGALTLDPLFFREAGRFRALSTIAWAGAAGVAGGFAWANWPWRQGT